MLGEMKTGAYVSGAGHVGLALWVLIGGLFVSRTDFDAVTVTDVSIISQEEFAAQQPSSPETGEAPPGLDAPSADEPAPALAQPEAPDAPANPAPAPVEQPEIDKPPAPVEAPPEPPQPVAVEEPDQPEGAPGAAVVAPDAPQAVPEQADVIADEVTEAPDPDAQIDDAAQSEVAPDAAAEVVPDEAQEETAAEQTTTQVVTEADETSDRAPTLSKRPGRKPTPPPAPAPTEVAEPVEDAPAVPGLQDLIEDAVTEANSPNAVENNASPGGGTGQSVTRQEKAAFILAIQKCWNVGALSTDALKVTVTVGFTMTPEAKPEIGSIRLVSAEGGSGAAVDRAYEAARRAIIRCGSAGFGLSPEKYDIWRNIEVRFSASRKEIR